MAGADRWAFLQGIGADPEAPRLMHRAIEEARAARTAPLPADLDPRLVEALARRGITELYAHQSEALALARAGRHVGVVTGTASGKTLAYGLPVYERLLADPHARAIYLAPTKALAQDQARGIAALGLGRLIRPMLYDGDTPPEQRTAARKSANLLLTNPDMLHLGVLPNQERWADVLANLTHVVVDEAHVYRGVFGAHVAWVLRRLRRLAARYGASPQLLLASATVANPAESMATLVGAPVAVVDDDASARPRRELMLWNPTLLDPDEGTRVSAIAEAAALVAELVARDVRTICFVQSRRGVEILLGAVREVLAGRRPDAVERVAPYRAGYTPEQRRALEQRLADGSLLAIVATSALELGIDVGLLDASIVVGFPGTIAALRQRWGRAGRSGDGLALLVAGEDALDQYLVAHPERLLGRPVEAVVLDPANPAVRTQHLACAAWEAPITEADDSILGDGAFTEAVELARDGLLQRSRAGISWHGAQAPAAAVSLRSSSAETVAIVEEETGALIGTVEAARAPATVHADAVYLHLGERFRVAQLDLRDGVATVKPFHGDWTTEVRAETTTLIETEVDGIGALGVALAFGEIEVAEQVTGFRRRRLPSREVIDLRRLDMPVSRFRTEALWLTVGPELLDGIERPLGTLHAAEHALISVLPLHAMCDRWDIGGLSTGTHAQTGMPTIFVYDGHPGGVGISRRGFLDFGALARDAHDVIARCPCSEGCPSCVQSPKCGNLNEPLSKHGALELLRRMLTAA